MYLIKQIQRWIMHIHVAWIILHTRSFIWVNEFWLSMFSCKNQVLGAGPDARCIANSVRSLSETFKLIVSFAFSFYWYIIV